MKSCLSPVVLLLFAHAVWGQSERPNYKSVADNFEEKYNAGDYDGIFALFGPEMQKALPLDKTNEFLSGLKSKTGKITSRQFVKYEQSYASYKTNFERALFTVNISVDNNSRINGLFIKPFVESNAPKIERNVTKLQLPFSGEWTVVWGGDTKELNYHVEHPAQKNAFDLVVTGTNGKSYKTEGKANEDYYAFGKEIKAPCDGEVTLVVDGIKDNTPGQLNPIYVPGNTVIIKAPKGEYLFFAHIKQGSIKVKQGQKVTTGQVLGLCGNSGNSSEPHLHFHIQNEEDMNSAIGAKCYFDTLVVNGEPRTDYSPIQKDKIRAQ